MLAGMYNSTSRSQCREIPHVTHLNRINVNDKLTYPRMFTLRRSDALLATGITHIVSVLRYDFKDFQDWGKYEHLSVEVDDVADEDLLGEFERTGSWIEEALKGVSNRRGVDGEMEEGCVDGKRKGGVLVHWSVAFLCCYHEGRTCQPWTPPSSRSTTDTLPAQWANPAPSPSASRTCSAKTQLTA